MLPIEVHGYGLELAWLVLGRIVQHSVEQLLEYQTHSRPFGDAQIGKNVPIDSQILVGQCRPGFQDTVDSFLEFDQMAG